MENNVDRWLRLMGGPEWEGNEGRDRAICEMRALGTDTVFPLLAEKLSDPDLDSRCAAIEAIGQVDRERAVELIVPLLQSSESVVRWTACGVLGAPEARTAVGPLLTVLRDDTDPQIRNSAAWALGHIGDLVAIPALLQALASDHEEDIHCHTPSHCAATALDDMLGTNHTRIRLSGSLCTMRPGSPDLESLREEAIQAYRSRAIP